MRCTVSGAAVFEGTGQQVSVASFGSDGRKLSLGLTLHVERDGKQHFISTGLLALALQPGSYSIPDADSDGFSLASYEVRSAQHDLIKAWSGSNYWLFYANRKNDPATKLQLLVTRLQSSAAKVPSMTRISLAGTAHFNAAYQPYVNGKLPDACTSEAILRTVQAGSRQYPQYSPSVCQSEKVEVDCSFDVTNDFLTSKP